VLSWRSVQFGQFLFSLFYSRCPPCQAICKSGGGGKCPRALWSRRHWLDQFLCIFMVLTVVKTIKMQKNYYYYFYGVLTEVAIIIVVQRCVSWRSGTDASRSCSTTGMWRTSKSKRCVSVPDAVAIANASRVVRKKLSRVTKFQYVARDRVNTCHWYSFFSSSVNESRHCFRFPLNIACVT